MCRNLFFQTVLVFLQFVYERTAYLNAPLLHLFPFFSTCDELSKLLQNILGVYFSVATLTLCSVAVRLNSVIVVEILIEKD